MNPRRTTPRAVVVLLVIGAACVAVRMRFRHQEERLAPGDSIWQLTYKARLHARKANAKLYAASPETTKNCRVFEHRIEESGLTLEARRPKHAAGDIVLSAPKAGQFEVKLQFGLHVSDQGEWSPERRDGKMTAKDRERCLQVEKSVQVSDAAVTATLERLTEGLSSRDEILERLVEYCNSDIMPAREGAPRDAVGALEQGKASALGHARALVALCRAAKIPARLVTGFEIRSDSSAHPHTWVEAMPGKHWDAYDPVYGYKHEVGHHFLPVRRDGVGVVRGSEDVTDLLTEYSIARVPPPPGMFDLTRPSALQILDLKQLPVNLHEPMRIILLMPLGALVTAVFRTIIGLRTFGTFTPTLLALAFVFNEWRTGLVVFVTVLVIGLVSRSLLDRLKLLLVPRLGIILTLVVVCMVFGVAVEHYFAWTPTGETVLLPMVILTMLVERFYVTTEEDSMRFSLQLLAGTMGLGFIVYLLLNWKAVGELVLVYPELHCFTVAVLVLIGRYTGYRWSELWRFRDMGAKP